MAERRRKFAAIMEEGRARTDRAFGGPAASARKSDAFLNAALAKARRLARLRELGGGGGAAAAESKTAGEEAVMRAVEKIKREEGAAATTSAESKDGGGGGGGGGSGITFEFDEIQEFTRALRARRGDPARRGAGERGRGVSVSVPGASGRAAVATTTSSIEAGSLETPERRGEEPGVGATATDVVVAAAATDDDDDDDADMREMAVGMDADDAADDGDGEDDGGGFGTTAELSAPVGRGMSSFLSHLKHTGEIRDHSTKEEMRGRAKDKRTYEDYERLDLDAVVRIGDATGRSNVHEKDAELARREIKLEYRDEHGRLLTRKEAYRDMCYQFHGHGSSKKNQERRLRQIEKERGEYSKSGASAAGGGEGTLGALKATQKATGKAFIIHKT